MLLQAKNNNRANRVHIPSGGLWPHLMLYCRKIGHIGVNIDKKLRTQVFLKVNFFVLLLIIFGSSELSDAQLAL
jgi:hypothetical protein